MPPSPAAAAQAAEIPPSLPASAWVMPLFVIRNETLSLEDYVN